MSATAVVTGIGVIAPSGEGTETYWNATKSGVNAISSMQRFDADQYPARLAGQIQTFSAAEHLPNRLLTQTDRMTQMALAAADWALLDANVDPNALPASEMGVITASSSGGFEFGQNELQQLWSRGSGYVSAYQSFAWFYAVNSGQISIRNGMKGPSGVVVSDQAGGIDALAQARRQIRKGTKIMVSGAVDASLCPWGWVAQMANGKMSTGTDPATAYVPFDSDAAGYVPGEGGAILIVEHSDHARERGARIYGYIAGYGATFDPAPGSSRSPSLGAAIERALDDAAVSADDIDVVFADGAATPELDRIEADALLRLIGSDVPVTVPKTGTGRLYSGAGALDIATALLALHEGVIPPTINARADRDALGLNLVTELVRSPAMSTAIVIGRGHGGFNAAMVLRKEQSETENSTSEK